MVVVEKVLHRVIEHGDRTSRVLAEHQSRRNLADPFAFLVGGGRSQSEIIEIRGTRLNGRLDVNLCMNR
jgi:hypothetical protein